MISQYIRIMGTKQLFRQTYFHYTHDMVANDINRNIPIIPVYPVGKSNVPD